MHVEKHTILGYVGLLIASVALTRSPTLIQPSTSLVTSFKDFEGLLDLGMIKLKAMEDEGWNANYTTRVEQEYKRFLYLVLYHNVTGVPSQKVDVMWHLHILDTTKYMQDCRTVFKKKYLHHKPSYTPDERADLKEPSRKFMEKYGEVFGPIPLDIWTLVNDTCDDECEPVNCEPVCTPPCTRFCEGRCDSSGDCRG